MIQKKTSEALLAIIIKVVLSVCFVIFIMKPSSDKEAIFQSVFFVFSYFMMGYSLCSLIQMVRSFTYCFLASFFSLMFVGSAYMSYLFVLPEVEEYGFKFAVVLVLTIILYSTFLIYDIFKVAPKPVLIQKFTNHINAYEVIDIPEATKNAVVKLVRHISNRRRAGGQNDIQDTSGE